MVLLSDRFHKSVDWILLEKGISQTHGDPRTRRKRQRVWLSVINRGNNCTQVLETSANRLISGQCFLLASMAPLVTHASRASKDISASNTESTPRLELGKPPQHQHRGRNVFQSSGRTFACLYRNLHQISPLHNHPKIALASGQYRNAGFRPTAETRFAPPRRNQREGNAPWLATRLNMDSLRGRL